MAFKDIKSQREGFKPNTDLCKDSLYRLISDSQSIKQRKKEYFQELLNGNIGMDDDIINGGNDLNNDDNKDTASSEVPTFEEIKISLKALKNNKAPGADNMPAELPKCCGDEAVRLIHKLIMDIWEKEYVPKEWRKSIICPIHKKGDKLECMNYRGIALLCTAYKVFANTMYYLFIFSLHATLFCINNDCVFYYTTLMFRHFLPSSGVVDSYL
jgi:hypothetical protein